MSGLSEDLRELGRLKKIEKILTRRKSEAGRRRKAFERHLYDRMVEEGFRPGDSSIRLGELQYVPVKTTYSAVQDRQAFIAWARENDAGLLESERIRESELNRVVNERIHNNQPLPPGIGSYDETYISTRGINKQTKHEEDDHDEGE